MTLPTQIYATLAEHRAERHADAEEDVHFTRGLAREVIEHLTGPGDVVLDPFAGFGTTLVVSHELGRTPVGVELLPERVASIQEQVPGAVVVEGDARGLLALADSGVLPLARSSVTLALTSPPWMTANDHPANPLTAYEIDDGDYRSYLDALADVAAQVRELLRPGGHLVLDVADIEHDDRLTPLVADAAAALAPVLELVGSVPVVWDELPHDLVANSLLVFSKPAGPAAPRLSEPEPRRTPCDAEPSGP
jgi:SAM-dependent methyltransferase